MCENPESKTALQRLEHRLLIASQRSEGRLEVDETYAYFMGKAILKEVWRLQSLEMGLPPDSYLNIAALANNEPGRHPVTYGNKTYLVELDGLIQSYFGPHVKVSSVTLQ